MDSGGTDTTNLRSRNLRVQCDLYELKEGPTSLRRWVVQNELRVNALRWLNPVGVFLIHRYLQCRSVSNCTVRFPRHLCHPRTL